MLNARQTQIILEDFFNDCYKFWRSRGHSERKAYALTIEDTIRLKRNPFVPIGGKLDPETKEKFIEYRYQDLDEQYGLWLVDNTKLL